MTASRTSTRTLTVLLGLTMVGPSAGQGDEVRRLEDIAFTAADPGQLLDVYLPPGPTEGRKRPGVVIVHGGGWGHRRRRERIFVHAATRLAESGFVAVVTDYMTVPDEHRGVSYIRNMAASFPRNVQDVKSAVRYLRRHAAEHGVDPDRIAVIGASSGAHLATLAAVTRPADGLEPEADGHGEVSSAVQAAVAYYGAHDWSTWGGPAARRTAADEEAGRRASTLRYVRRDTPPLLVIHGTRDRTVPFAQSQRLVDALRDAGAPHEFVVWEGKDHGTFYRPDRSGVDDHALVVEFLRKHMPD